MNEPHTALDGSSGRSAGLSPATRTPSPTTDVSDSWLGIRRLRSIATALDVFGVQGVPKRLHRGLKSLWYFGFFASSAGAFFFSYIPLYLLSIGATATEVGLLSSIGNFVGLLSPLPGAALTRKRGDPRGIVVAFSVLHRLMLVVAAVLPLFLSGQSLIYGLIAAFAMRLAFISIVNPAFVSMMGSVVPEHVRGRYLGARMMAMAMASAVLVPFAGWIIDQIGEPLGYQVTLGIAVVLGLVSASTAIRIPDFQIRGSVDELRKSGSFWEAVRANPVFRSYLVIRLLWHFVWQLGGPYFPVFQREILGSSVQLIGWLATASALSGLIGQRFWGRVVDRIGARWVFCACTLMLPILPLSWAVVTRPWHVIFISLPGGFLWAGFNMGSLNLQLELPKPEHRTQMAAAQMMAMRIGNILGPLVGTILIARFGYRWDFAISGIGRLVVALCFVLLLQPFVKRQAETV